MKNKWGIKTTWLNNKTNKHTHSKTFLERTKLSAACDRVLVFAREVRPTLFSHAAISRGCEAIPGGVRQHFPPPPPHPWERRLMAYWTCVLLGRNAKHPLKTIYLRAGGHSRRFLWAGSPLMKAHQEGNDADVKWRGKKIPRSPDRKPSRWSSWNLWPSPRANVTNDTYRPGNISLSVDFWDWKDAKRGKESVHGELQS